MTFREFTECSFELLDARGKISRQPDNEDN